MRLRVAAPVCSDIFGLNCGASIHRSTAVSEYLFDYQSVNFIITDLLGETWQLILHDYYMQLALLAFIMTEHK